MKSIIFFMSVFLAVFTTCDCLEPSSSPPFNLRTNLANNSKQIMMQIPTNTNFELQTSTSKADYWKSLIRDDFRKRIRKKDNFGKTKSLFHNDQLENISEKVTSLSLPQSRIVSSMYGKKYEMPDCPAGFTYHEITDCLGEVVSKYCYEMQEVDYPHQCQYFDYAHIEHKLPDGAQYYLAKRDPLYGYYEIREPGLFYRRLVTGDPNIELSLPSEWLECAIGWPSGCHSMLEVTVERCNHEEVYGVCFYDGSEYNFCHNFMDICNRTCSCVQYENRFSCETDGCSDDNCQQACIEKFEAYPAPEVIMELVGYFIYITVKNPLKLAQKHEPELHCFSENNNASSQTLWEKQSLYQFGDWDGYMMFLDHGGLYWCEYFTYPDMEVMKSDDFFFKYEDVVSFIVNVTVMLNMDPLEGQSFLPYDIPWRILDQINVELSFAEIVIEDLFLVRIHPIRHSELTADFTYRINLSDRSEEDISLIRDELQDVLSHFNSSTYLALADRCLKISSDSEPYLTFPTTRIGGVAAPIDTLIVDEDGLPITRRCFGSYGDGAFWAELNTNITFGQLSSMTEELLRLLSKNVSAQERNTELFKIIHDGQEVVIPYDVYLISQILQQIVSSDDTFNIVTFTRNVNSVMRFPKIILSKSQQTLNATDVILYSFDLALGRIANEKSTGPIEIPVHIRSDLILAQVANIQASEVNGVAIYRRKGNYVMERLRRISNFDQVDFTNLTFATFLPPAFLELLERIHPGDAHLVTAFFLNDALFDPMAHETLAEYAVSLFVPNLRYPPHPDLMIPMYFNVAGGNRTCALWRYGIDFQLRSIFGSWERHYEALDATGMFCRFPHMTHFTLLVNAPTSAALNILSSVVSIASIIGICLIVATAVAFPKWRKQSSIIVLINYSASVLLQHILLFLFELNPDMQGIFCKIIGILSHYVILVQFSWFLVISYTQYLKLVVVFGAHLEHFLVRICISVWLLPVIPVAIAASINLNDYACFLTGYCFYFALVLPISLIVLINAVVFGRILHSLFCLKASDTPAKRDELQRVGICIILFFLMGFTWIFGLMANFFNAIILSYLFCIFTACHGLILSVYFILIQHYTREMWTLKLRRCCCGNVAYKKGSFSITQSS